MDITPREIDDYCSRHTATESELFAELAVATRNRTDLPQMQVGHLEGAFLRVMVRAVAARFVVEVGTFTGYSALAMAEALPEDGRLVTCDIDPINTRIAEEFWSRSPHGKKIELRLGPAVETLTRIDGPIDLAFIDADKVNYGAYWDLLVPRMRPGGMILCDNVLWSGRVLDPQDATTKAIAEFNRMVASDSRVEAVMVPLRDGVTIAWKH